MDSGGGISTSPALDKFQKSVNKLLGPQIATGLGQGGATPFGPTTVPRAGEPNFWFPQGPGDELFRQAAFDYAQAPISYQFQPMIEQALSGLDTGASAQRWRENVFPEQQRLFTENILPNVIEGGGRFPYWSSPRADAEINAYRDFGVSANAQMQDYINQQQLQAQGMLPTVAALERSLAQEPVQRAGVALQAEQLQRQLQGQELFARFEEFKRTQPEYSPYIDIALAYLGLQNEMGIGDSGGMGIGGLLGGAAGGIGGFFLGGPAGAAAGFGIGSQIGGSI